MITSAAITVQAALIFFLCLNIDITHDIIQHWPKFGNIVDMSRIKRRRFISAVAKSPITYILLVIFCALFIYSAIGAYEKSRLAREKLRASESELAELQDQKRHLSGDLENANTPFGTEKAIREKFNMVREGEKAIVIVDDTENTDQETVEKGGFWSLLKRIFGGGK